MILVSKKEMHRDNKWTRPSTTSPTPNNPHKTNVQMHFYDDNNRTYITI